MSEHPQQVTVLAMAGQDLVLGELMDELAMADAAGQLPEGWVRRDG